MPDGSEPEKNEDTARRRIREAGERAKAEADARRKQTEAERTKTRLAPKEAGGREGLDPVRFGDWEVKGVASDF